MEESSKPVSQLWPQPSADALRSRFLGAPITELPTPALLVDRARIAQNCAAMLATAERHWYCRFRAHIKTHKTREATVAQVGHSRDHAIVVSTLAEAWGVLDSGLVRDGTVLDILYGVPLGINKIAQLLALRREAHRHNAAADVKALIDHPAQIDALQTALSAGGEDAEPFNIFIKIDCGYMRAGLSPTSPALPVLLYAIAEAPNISVWGLYSHAGFSYDSRTLTAATSYLSREMQSVNDAARLVSKQLGEGRGSESSSASPSLRMRTPLVLSVGSTPTAHAAIQALQPDQVALIRGEVAGELELHAGNYPFLDLQQVATNAVPDSNTPAIERCALTVLTSINSCYPGRAVDGKGDTQAPKGSQGLQKASAGDEAMCDAGGIAVSKDTGPFGGYGHVVWPRKHVGWQLGRIAQEHGVMTLREGSTDKWAAEWGFTDKQAREPALVDMPGPEMLCVGDHVQIVPQHACMTAAAHPWFFVYDSTSGEATPSVVDIWVPWKGW